MNITAVARTFLISFLVILCLALPARAENVSAQHIAHRTLSQVTANQTGINAYRKNLNRLRSASAKASRSQPPSLSPTAKDFSEPPQPTGINATKTESSEKQFQKQRSNPAEQQPKFSFKQVFNKNNSKENQVPPQAPEAESLTNQSLTNQSLTNQSPTKVVKGRPTQPQGISAYEMVQAARQPYNPQEGTSFLPPSFPNIAPNQLSEQLSERVSQIHTSIQQQPERLNKTVVEPLQEKITALKEQASATAKTTFKEQIESRGLTGRELIDSSGVSDRIHQTQKNLTASVVDILRQVETKAHETAEQLNDATR